MKTYKDFRISDLFNITTGSLLKMKDIPLGNVPRISARSDNNGILGYYDTINNPNARHAENFISVNFFGNAFYHPYLASLEMKVHCLKLKSREFTEPIGLYLVAALNKAFAQQGYSYSEQLSSSDLKKQDLRIRLPVTATGQPDWDYMQDRIAELEQDRIAELEAYLKVTGLDDYKLTDEDRKALALSPEPATNKATTFEDTNKHRSIRFKKFLLGELFESSTGDVDLQQKDVNGKGCFLVNSGVDNRGIKGKTDRPAKVFPPNTITIDFWGNAYYRDFEYKMATHNHVFSLKGDVIKNRLVGLYLVGQLSKLPLLFSYNNMATWNKLKKLEITLPVTKDDKIAFDYMEHYIKAIEKLTIADVVKYKDKFIKTTKELVSK